MATDNDTGRWNWETRQDMDFNWSFQVQNEDGTPAIYSGYTGTFDVRDDADTLVLRCVTGTPGAGQGQLTFGADGTNTVYAAKSLMSAKAPGVYRHALQVAGGGATDVPVSGWGTILKGTVS